MVICAFEKADAVRRVEEQEEQVKVPDQVGSITGVDIEVFVSSRDDRHAETTATTTTTMRENVGWPVLYEERGVGVDVVVVGSA